MSTKKIDKKSAVKLIVSSLKKGIDKKSIFDNLLQSFTITRQSVNTYYNEAEKQFLEFKKKADPIIEAKEIEALGEVAKAGILSKLERQKILTDIARGDIPLTKHIVCDGVIQEREVVPNWADRRAAIAELNKMDGDYAPMKTEVKGELDLINPLSNIIIEITPPTEDD